MARFASLFAVTLALGFLMVSLGVAEVSPTSVEEALEVSVDSTPVLEMPAEQLFTPSEPQAMIDFGQDLLLPPTTGLRVCDDVEEASCAPCGCIFVRNAVKCLCF